MQSDFYTTPSGERLVCRRNSRSGSSDPPDGSAIAKILHGLQPRSPYGRRKNDEFRLLLHWHDSKWLYVTVAMLTLCTLDAILTLKILSVGGKEVNAFMAALINTDIELFAWLKITLTAFGSVVLVAFKHLTFFRVFNVGQVLLLLLSGYFMLITYEAYLLAGIFLF